MLPVTFPPKDGDKFSFHNTVVLLVWFDGHYSKHQSCINMKWVREKAYHLKVPIHKRDCFHVYHTRKQHYSIP